MTVRKFSYTSETGHDGRSAAYSDANAEARGLTSSTGVPHVFRHVGGRRPYYVVCPAGEVERHARRTAR